MALAILSPLHRADGSATYTKNGYSVIAAVNGPIEMQRRDEIPEEAAVDVAVRPAVGVGGKCQLIVSSKKLYAKSHLGLREKRLESIIQNTLRHVILVSAHPRSLIQFTLQIVTIPEDDSVTGSLPQAASVGSSHM